MDRRDTILAKLALGLGLIDDAGLQRAMALSARSGGKSFDQVLVGAGLIDPKGHQRLAQAFNQHARQQQRRPGAPGAPARRPGAAPRRPPPPAASAPLSLKDEGGAIRNEDSVVLHAQEEGPFPSSAAAAGRAGGGDLAVPDDDADLSLPPDEDDLAVPDDDDLSLPPDVLAGGDDDGSFDEPTVVIDPGRPAGEPTEDELLAEPTLVLQEDQTKPGGQARPKPPADAQLGGLSEDELLAEPTLVLQEDQTKPGGARRPPPSERPAEDDRSEDELLSEPTLVLQENQTTSPAVGPREWTPDDEAGDDVFGQPTVVISGDEAEGSGDPGPASAPPRPAGAGPVARRAKGRQLSESSQFEIDTSLLSSSRRRGSQAPAPGGGGAQKAGGPLDHEEFQRRLKMRLGFTGFNLGDYKILGELARGAFGVVLEVEPDGVAKSLARERGYSGNLALKVMLENKVDPRETERFLDEVRVLIGFDHPHIVRIFDAGVEEGLTYYAMELVHGIETRAHVLRQGPMPPLLAVRVVKEIASALSYVHNQQIYHRDLKPQNIMLDQSTQPYRSLLIDFGLVQEKQDQRDKGLIMGTPSYMPPEQAKPRGNYGPVNATSDIYALGASMFFLLTGKPPFGGRDPRKIIQDVLQKPPPDPAALNPKIPRRIADVCLKCLQKAQRDRYHSSRQLEAELDKELRSGRRMLKAKSIFGRFFGGSKP